MAGVVGLLKRVTGKRPAEGEDQRPLSDEVQAYLVREFRLPPPDMADLRCVLRRESLGSAVKLIRIFDAAKARRQGIAVRSFQDLGRHPDLILFYGRLSKRGVSYLKREYRTLSSRSKM